MTMTVTPYDTAERLEPQPWVMSRRQMATPVRFQADHHGLDDPAGDGQRLDRVLDVEHVLAASAGGVGGHDGSALLVVEVDPAEVLGVGLAGGVSAPEHSPGVEELLSLAERGREELPVPG